MASRRLVRHGRLLVEQQLSVAPALAPSACPACRRAASTTVPLPTRATDAAHQASSWASIARAGQALLNGGGKEASASSLPASSHEPSAELTGAAKDLVNELRMKRPDPQRTWQLFSQVDLDGTLHLLPARVLHLVLPAIHSVPAKPAQLDVQASTAAARAYDAKVNMIMLRLRQVGGTRTLGDLGAMLLQYHALRYAPGATKTWDEFMAAGQIPSASLCAKTFEAMVGWIDLHVRTGGRQVAQAAAVPLVRKAVAMLSDLQGDSKRADVVLESFFKILLRARDSKAFFIAMQDVYGFDINYPGAASYSQSQHKQISEQELAWILEILSETGDLSKMITVFEHFDHMPSSTAPSYFAHSFHSPASAANAQLSTLAPEVAPHPVGKRAFATLIREASRQKNGAVVRHYLDQLIARWHYMAHLRISELEKLVGVEFGSVRAPEGEASEASVASVPVSVAAEPPLGMPAVAPSRPYAVPSTLIRDAMHQAKASYDKPTARRIRMRTRRILQVMREQVDRLKAVLARFEQPVEEDSTPSSSTANPRTATVPASLKFLSHEIDVINFHRIQLESMYSVMKADTNVVSTYATLRHRMAELQSRSRRRALDAASSSSRRGAPAANPGLEAKRKSVLLARIALVQHRLVRLKRLGRAHKGRKTWDYYVAEFRRLRAEAAEKGYYDSSEQAVSESPADGSTVETHNRDEVRSSPTP